MVSTELKKLDQEVDWLTCEVGDLDLENQKLTEKLAELQSTQRQESLEQRVISNQLHQAQNSLDEIFSGELTGLRAELYQAQRQPTEPTIVQLPEPTELLNQFRKKLPKSKISLREVELLLELL
ncbi:MAG TPA: hypothetical protein V6D15_04550 [Oculatellaceae cyanobacterium]|jgi:regulator of replication initiation timing